ncbi:hypothetical protein ACQ7HM_02130 [Williamsia sp. MIQD14]|uniref:hypothetical protein n=1 Tax=Williamsia sp. MIQD14 TaxID=3425703 RepID=UPI003D9FCE8E
MTSFPVDDNGLVHRDSALRVGLSDKHLAAAVRDGRLTRLRAGTYLLTTPSSPEHRHRLRVEASTQPDTVVSHHSAAVIHGFGMLHPPLRRVHTTSGATTGGRISPTRHMHAGPLDGADVTGIDGLLVTSGARTAVDVACAGDFDQALVVFDSALRVGVQAIDLAAEVDGRRRRGIGVARRALAHADGASASVGESWSRAQMITAGLPIPALQREHTLQGRRVVTDFDWDDRLVGEFDGQIKYGRLLKPGQRVEDVIADEKAREDLLRWSDRMVVRWIWPQLVRREVVGIIRPWLDRLECV